MQFLAPQPNFAPDGASLGAARRRTVKEEVCPAKPSGEVGLPTAGTRSYAWRGHKGAECVQRSRQVELDYHMHCVYILKLKNDEYYTGYSANLQDRITRHFQGTTKHTKDNPPDRLIFYAAFSDKQTALGFEKYLKSSSGKAFRNKHLISTRTSAGGE